MDRAALFNKAREKAGRMARGQDGATAVEFALVGTPFLGLLLLVIQVGAYFFSLQSLDNAVRSAGRDITTGQVSTAITTASAFKTNLLCPRVFWGIDCTKLVINAYKVGKTSKAADSSGVYAFINTATKSLKPPQTDPTKQSFCLGGPGDYIFLDVSYPYPNYVGRLLSVIAGPTMAMRATTFTFNEPYRTASASGSC